MATENESILIDINFSYEEAVAGVVKFKSRLVELRREQAELEKSFRSGEVSADDYTAANAKLSGQIEAARKTMNDYQREIKNVEVALDSQMGSYESLNAQLLALKKQYQQLSREEREGAKGQEMLSHIHDLDTELKAIDKDMGQYFRNVGNYPSALEGLVPGFSNLKSVLGALGVSFTDLQTKGVKAFAGLGTSVQAFGKMFLTPPIIVIAATLSAIMLAVEKVSDAIKKNDDVGTSLQRSYAALQPVLTLVGKAFEGLVTVLAKVVETGAKALSSVLSFIPGYKQAAAAAQELVTAEDNLQEAERAYTRESASRQAEISELRAKAQEEDEYTLAERRKFLEESMKLMEEENAAARKNLEERIRIAKARAEQERDTSDATKDAIADMEAAMSAADARFYSDTRTIQRQLNSLSGTAAATVDRTAEYAARAAEIHRQLRDAVIATIKDAGERSKAELEAQYGDELDGLRTRLATERNLTEREKDELAQLIKLKEDELQAAVQSIDDEASAERIQRDYAAALEAVRLRVSAAKKGSEEEYAARTELLEKQRAAELGNAELTEQERKNIEEKYRQQRVTLESQHSKDMMRILRDDIVSQVKETGTKAYKAEKESLERMLDVLDGYTDEQKEKFAGSLDDFDEYVKKLRERYGKTVDDYKKTELQLWLEFLNGMSQTFGALGDVMDAFGADSRAFVIAEQSTALIEVAITQGIAISEAIRAALEGSHSWLSAAVQIATAVATVTSQFASVVSNIKSATSGSYATGGIIPGNSVSGDRLIARVNSGEMILNRSQQAAAYSALTGESVGSSSLTGSRQQALFSLLGGGASGSGGGFATGGIVSRDTSYRIAGLVANAPSVGTYGGGISGIELRDALESMPAPVMEYREFKRFEKNTERSVNYAQLRKK